jgi:hypothetical protein
VGERKKGSENFSIAKIASVSRFKRKCSLTGVFNYEAMPWPDDNARTSPVTQGNLQVRP